MQRRLLRNLRSRKLRLRKLRQKMLQLKPKQMVRKLPAECGLPHDKIFADRPGNGAVWYVTTMKRSTLPETGT
jgi:hypothetical protein